MRESELHFRQLTENINQALFLTDAEGKQILYVSPVYEKIFGRKPETLIADPESWLTGLNDGDRAKGLASLDRVKTMGRFENEYHIKLPDGSMRWVRTLGFPIRNGEGKIYRIAGLAADITERKEAHDRILRLNRVYKMLSSINSLIVHVKDREELFREACRIAVEDGGFRMAWIGELPPGEDTIKPVACAGHEDGYLQHINISTRHDDPGKDSASGRAVHIGKPVVHNNIARETDDFPWKQEAIKRGYGSAAGMPLFIAENIAGVLSLYTAETDFFDDEELELLTELSNDISYALQNIIKEEQLEYLTSYDPLTGLANRTLFNDHLNSVLVRAKGSKKHIALLVCDLKQFRNINNVYGPETGDRILQETARRLHDLTSDPVNIGRITSDYFVMILHDVGDSTGIAYEFENSLFPALNQPFLVDNEVIQASFTGGIAVFPGDGDDAETLYRNAEAALKKAKLSGEKYLFYQPEMTARIAETLQIESKLRAALKEEQYVLHYQPKIDARTRTITGLEALIRWNDPDTGLVPPGKFIPILEETGLILDVGLWAAGKAASDYRKWQKQLKLAPPRIAVNVSSVQLRQKDFVELITRSIRRKGKAIPLEIEITESLIMTDIEQNITKLKAIQMEDIQIAIDDFGTGYSSLSYISRLPINSLKIDRSFIMNMTTKPESMTIVSSIIALAHALNFKVVAEGVETEEQAKLLTLLKCNEMQGFLFSKPLPADEIFELLRSGKTL